MVVSASFASVRCMSLLSASAGIRHQPGLAGVSEDSMQSSSVLAQMPLRLLADSARLTSSSSVCTHPWSRLHSTASHGWSSRLQFEHQAAGTGPAAACQAQPGREAVTSQHCACNASHSQAAPSQWAECSRCSMATDATLAADETWNLMKTQGNTAAHTAAHTAASRTVSAPGSIRGNLHLISLRDCRCLSIAATMPGTPAAAHYSSDVLENGGQAKHNALDTYPHSAGASARMTACQQHVLCQFVPSTGLARCQQQLLLGGLMQAEAAPLHKLPSTRQLPLSPLCLPQVHCGSPICRLQRSSRPWLGAASAPRPSACVAKADMRASVQVSLLQLPTGRSLCGHGCLPSPAAAAKSRCPGHSCTQ